MKLTDFLVREAIITELRATTRDDALRELVRSLQDAGHLAGVDPENLFEALVYREGLGSTAIGQNVAVPHGGHPAVDRVIGTVALAPHGVDFKALDGKTVDVLILMLHPPNATGGIPPVRPSDPVNTLHAFEALARSFQDDAFLGRLRRCRTRDEVFELLIEADREAPNAP